jgi:hypothetical protein
MAADHRAPGLPRRAAWFARTQILDGVMTPPRMAATILLRPVAEPRAHRGNAHVHSAARIKQIEAGMLAFGFTNPLLADKAGVLT